MIFVCALLIALASTALGCLLEHFAPNVAERLFPSPLADLERNRRGES